MIARLSRCRRMTGLFAALLLAGCATVRSVPPLTRIDGRSCHAKPELNAALPLEAGKSVKTEIDTGSPCLVEGHNARSAYTVIRLPRSVEPYLIDVTSRPLGATLLSPRLMVLDEQGALLREVPRENFVFRGATLHAGMWARPGDGYLVVASDPASVGQLTSRLVSSSHVNTMPVGVGGVIMVHSGSESQAGYMFAHNGEIEVAARPAPKIN
jgi:hypothetical protein